MTHVLICGMTESGKTLAAKALLREFKARGVDSIVLDPLHDPNWGAAAQCSDPRQFLELVKRSRSCALFLDESGETVGRYNDEMFWLATRARHFGHKTVFITQQPAQISPTVRAQCSMLLCFTVSKNAGKMLAEEFGHPELETANTLPQFHYFMCGRFAPLERRVVQIPGRTQPLAPEKERDHNV